MKFSLHSYKIGAKKNVLYVKTYKIMSSIMKKGRAEALHKVNA